MEFENIIYFFTIYSIIGWVIESVYYSLLIKKITSRSFHWGPFSPLYGFGALFIIPLLNFHLNILELFLYSLFITTALEYFTSLAFEKMFHIKWWDYSDQQHNLQGRICLRNSVYWGSLSTIFLTQIHPHINNLVNNFTFYHFIPTLLITFYIIDTSVAWTNFAKVSQIIKSGRAKIKNMSIKTFADVHNFLHLHQK